MIKFICDKCKQGILEKKMDLDRFIIYKCENCGYIFKKVKPEEDEPGSFTDTKLPD